jgi:ribosome-binding ATPase
VSLSIGIVGLPNVGKSTLFNAVTGAAALAANYPFATIDPNVGVVPIPDPRLPVLARMFGSARVVPATVRFVDIAGLVRGASAGEGLGNQFLGNIRDVSAVCHVVRVFGSSRVAHVDQGIDPLRDISTVEAELALADLDTIDKRLPRMEREATVDRSLAPRVALLAKVRQVVASGRMVSSRPDLIARQGEFADLHLLTAKPVIYGFNCDTETLADPGQVDRLVSMVAPAEAVLIDAQLEAELARLEPDEQTEILGDAGEPGLHKVIRAAYRALGLQSFLTAGPKESRAWTIRAGSTAPEAAGVIHTDFQRGFIAAEVVAFDKLVAAGSWNAARAKGMVRSEGKAYVMQHDDVVEFRFNI